MCLKLSQAPQVVCHVHCNLHDRWEVISKKNRLKVSSCLRCASLSSLHVQNALMPQRGNTQFTFLCIRHVGASIFARSCLYLKLRSKGQVVTGRQAEN